MKGNSFLHFFRFLLGIDQPLSQTTEKERLVIAKFASQASVCAEIGVYEGVNTVNIAQRLFKSGKLYAIDPFFKGSLGISYCQKIAYYYAKKNHVLNSIIFIKNFSYNAKDDIPNNIDFIFIDGDHSLSGIERDWNDWSKKIKIGGFIALHDTSIPAHDQLVATLGSYIFFNSFIINDNRFEVVETVDSLNVLKRLS